MSSCQCIHIYMPIYLAHACIIIQSAYTPASCINRAKKTTTKKMKNKARVMHPFPLRSRYQYCFRFTAQSRAGLEWGQWSLKARRDVYFSLSDTRPLFSHLSLLLRSADRGDFDAAVSRSHHSINRIDIEDFFI